jgi:hypothetical protein
MAVSGHAHIPTDIYVYIVSTGEKSGPGKGTRGGDYSPLPGVEPGFPTPQLDTIDKRTQIS